MKITILGGAGVRTPLIVEAIARRQTRLGLDELALMDIDGEHLELIGALTAPLEQDGDLRFHITRTTDPRLALTGAHFVITTFRVGGIESRVVDEQVPLRHAVLGQETTGPGGFAMGLRTIPVILEYLQLMREVCPQAWLVNFANPAGMLAEAVWRDGWQRVVGICDAPHGMARVAAALTGAEMDGVYLDYFGLNHLGWVRSVISNGRDYLPEFLALVQQMPGIPGLPFEAGLLKTLGMIPNEYLYYYYYAQSAVQNMLQAGATRGERIADANRQLFAKLRRLWATEDLPAMLDAYHAYLDQRGATYMVNETGQDHSSWDLEPSMTAALQAAFEGEGYAGVALDLIEGLTGGKPRIMVLNVPNRGAVAGMQADQVVEIPAFVGADLVRPLAVGEIPPHCLGLMQAVKAYEGLTIQAATQVSYELALQALTIHPLVRDRHLAKSILDGYIAGHGDYFPPLV